MSKTYTVELEWLVPVFCDFTVEADSPDEAERLAYEAADRRGYDDQETNWDGCSNTYCSGIWEGEQTWSGEDVRTERQIKSAENEQRLYVGAVK